jgi:hypothetical protein
MRPQFKDISGQTFGRLLALWPIGKKDGKNMWWTCQCEDGNVVIARGAYLRNGSTRSCGCIWYEITKTSGKDCWKYKHGFAQKPENSAYYTARSRCTSPNHPDYHNYGGRGIKFKFKSFLEFLVEIGPKPSPELTLDRINNNGHYEKGNIRWATRVQQNNNTRAQLKH